MFSRFLENTALTKKKDVEKDIYLVENADIKTNVTTNNI